MRLSRTFLLILGIGACAVIFAFLYLNYQQSAQERDLLLDQIEASQRKVSAINAEKRNLEPQVTQLENKISDLNKSFDQLKGEFPNITVQSIEYDEELTGLADDSEITFMKVTATEDSDVKEGNLTYTVSNFSVEVEGERVDLLDFIHRVATSVYFKTSSVNVMTLEDEVPPASPPPTPVLPKVKIDLGVYRYRSN